MKKKVLVSTTLALIVVLSFAYALLANAHTESAPFCIDLLSGRKLEIDVGDVLVWNDAEYLYVQYVLHWQWYVTEIHLHVATDLNEIPQKNGNPIPGQFAIKYEFDAPEHEPPVIALELKGSWTPGTQLYVAAHAAARYIDCCNCIDLCETAWGGWCDFPGKNWATYFHYTVQ